MASTSPLVVEELDGDARQARGRVVSRPPLLLPESTVPLIDALKRKTSLCRFVMSVFASMTLASVLPCCEDAQLVRRSTTR